MCTATPQGFKKFLATYPKNNGICYKCGSKCHKPFNSTATQKEPRESGSYKKWCEDLSTWDKNTAHMCRPNTFYNNGHNYKVTRARMYYELDCPYPGGEIREEVVTIPAVWSDVDETYSAREQDSTYNSRSCTWRKMGGGYGYETDSDESVPDTWVQKTRTTKKLITPESWKVVKVISSPNNNTFWAYYEYFGEVINECHCINCKRDQISHNIYNKNIDICLRCRFDHAMHQLKTISTSNFIFYGVYGYSCDECHCGRCFKKSVNDMIAGQVIGFGCQTNRSELIKEVAKTHPMIKNTIFKVGEKNVLLDFIDCDKCRRQPMICLDICLKCNDDHHTRANRGCSGLMCVRCKCFRCCVERTPKKPILMFGFFDDEKATRDDFYERLVDGEYPEIRGSVGEQICMNDMKMLGDSIIGSYC